MKTFEFDLTNIITYQEYLSIVKKLQDWYQEKRLHIKSLYANMIKNQDYTQSLEIIKEHNNLVIELINMIISELKIDKNEFGIYISNSFARETNLLNSDMDLNFMYEDSDLYVYEELISSMLADVLGKYRSFVHDSISHHLSSSQLNQDEILSYQLKFKDKIVTKEISEGNISLMYKLYNTSKKREDFIKYYIKWLNDKDITEWIYYQKPIYDKDNYLNVLFDYIKKLEDLSKNKKLEEYITYLVEEINKEKQELTNNQFTDIADIKRYYKNHAFKVINDFLTILTKDDENSFKFESIGEKIDRVNNEKITNMIRDYFGRIMALDYICEEYGIGFRTRYRNEVTPDFKKFYYDNTKEELENLNNYLIDLYEGILYYLDILVRKAEVPKFEVETEHINIASYSPLWHINNVSKEYHKGYYLMPFIEDDKGNIIPIHPDLMEDLNISRSKIVDEMLVYPTSSTRTVYSPSEQVCYKLPVLRQITRSIRKLSEKELKRSEIADSYLSKYSYPNFDYLKEECFHNDNELFNYIKRSMPEKRVYPWFYLIVSNILPKNKMLEIIRNLISIWMYYASHGIYFESFHTQNILVDEDGGIYYRDLSDVRILTEPLMCPSYLSELKNTSEFLAISFDRSVLMQNIEHFIRYRKDLNENDVNYIKNIIQNEIYKYGLEFPDYSLDYDKNKPGHHPIKCELTRLRKR